MINFKTLEIDNFRNKATGVVKNQNLEFIDLEYHKGEFIARESLRASVVIINGFNNR